MSNSIWKTLDETPASCFLCVFDRPMVRSVGHYNPVKKQFCSGELRFEHKEIDKFCTIDDLIAQADKAERLQKAVDFAVDALKGIDWCAQDYAIAQEALSKITALEQKD